MENRHVCHHVVRSLREGPTDSLTLNAKATICKRDLSGTVTVTVVRGYRCVTAAFHVALPECADRSLLSAKIAGGYRVIALSTDRSRAARVIGARVCVCGCVSADIANGVLICSSGLAHVEPLPKLHVDVAESYTLLRACTLRRDFKHSRKPSTLAAQVCYHDSHGLFARPASPRQFRHLFCCTSMQPACAYQLDP